mmetsp:Transcript_6725/g.20367  ORF Transcript_6725/g.20367 Transcript_6725/m.20367 type:complete len:599 (-) Transcript_6725:89-1885(-)
MVSSSAPVGPFALSACSSRPMRSFSCSELFRMPRRLFTSAALSSFSLSRYSSALDSFCFSALTVSSFSRSWSVFRSSGVSLGARALTSASSRDTRSLSASALASLWRMPSSSAARRCRSCSRSRMLRYVPALCSFESCSRLSASCTCFWSSAAGMLLRTSSSWRATLSRSRSDASSLARRLCTSSCFCCLVRSSSLTSFAMPIFSALASSSALMVLGSTSPASSTCGMSVMSFSSARISASAMRNSERPSPEPSSSAWTFSMADAEVASCFSRPFFSDVSEAICFFISRSSEENALFSDSRLVMFFFRYLSSSSASLISLSRFLRSRTAARRVSSSLGLRLGVPDLFSRSASSTATRSSSGRFGLNTFLATSSLSRSTWFFSALFCCTWPCTLRISSPRLLILSSSMDFFLVRSLIDHLFSSTTCSRFLILVSARSLPTETTCSCACISKRCRSVSIDISSDAAGLAASFTCCTARSSARFDFWRSSRTPSSSETLLRLSFSASVSRKRMRSESFSDDEVCPVSMEKTVLTTSVTMGTDVRLTPSTDCFSDDVCRLLFTATTVCRLLGPSLPPSFCRLRPVRLPTTDVEDGRNANWAR